MKKNLQNWLQCFKSRPIRGCEFYSQTENQTMKENLQTSEN